MPKAAGFASALPPHLAVRSHTILTSLWSNYGHIYRLTLSADSPDSPRTLILKLIQPPHIPTTAADESHLRKLLSYRVERYFYAHLAPRLTPLSPVAKSYPVAATSRDEALLLEDLGLTYPLSGSYSTDHAHAVLKWLANFHAAYWRIELPALVAPPLRVEVPEVAEGVWEQGGYWYLDTRGDEMQALREAAEGGEYKYLVRFCEYAAGKLRSAPGGGLGVTLLHGDCKGANIVFTSEEEPRCALYDFQYVGLGLGVQDLAYFLGTSVNQKLLQGEEGLLRLYYDELIAALGRRGVVETEYTWEVMMMQWEWALVDWMRFVAGWGFWGNARWVEKRVRAICKRWEAEGVGMS